MRLELQAEKGDTADPLRRTHRLAVRRLHEHALPLHAPADGGGSTGSGTPDAPARTKSRRWRRSKKRSPTSRNHADVSEATPTERRRPARLHGSGLAEGRRQPDRRRRAVLRRGPRHAAARGDLLLDQLLAGDRTGRHRNLLRPGGRLGVRIHPAPDAKVEERQARSNATQPAGVDARESGTAHVHHPRPRHLGRSPCSKARATRARHEPASLEGLPKVTINGASASELRTELGTLLSFERSGVRYVLAGSVTPAAIEALARGL